MSQQTRQRRRKRAGGNPLVRVGLVLGCLGIFSVAGWVAWTAAKSPGIDELKPTEPGAVSVVYAADGSRLGFISTVILRTPVQGSLIPNQMGQATVAIEDRRFYKHTGVDYEGIVRAALRNATSGKALQGGSTLTMQLARNLYIPGERSQKSLDRKVKEAKWALELESEH